MGSRYQLNNAYFKSSGDINSPDDLSLLSFFYYYTIDLSNMKLIYILLATSSLFLFSCSSYESEENYLPVISGNVELVQEIPNSADQMKIYDLVDFDLNSENQLYLLDPAGYTVNIFDKDGSYVKSTGRKGSGPGEFRAPGSVRLCGDKLLISEPRLGGVHHFDTDLNYIEAVSFKHFILDITCLGSEAIIYSALQSGTNLGIVKVSDTQNRELYYPSQSTLRDGILNTLITDMNENGEIYAAYRFRNKILNLNSDGEINFELSIPNWEDIVELTDENMPEFNLIRSITIDDNDNLLILGGGYSDNDGKDVIIYDLSEEQFLGYFTLPVMGVNIKWHNSHL
jgi:hypothetical protein